MRLHVATALRVCMSDAFALRLCMPLRTCSRQSDDSARQLHEANTRTTQRQTRAEGQSGVGERAAGAGHTYRSLACIAAFDRPCCSLACVVRLRAAIGGGSALPRPERSSVVLRVLLLCA